MLELKRVGINMRWESIAFINRDCTLFRPEVFLAMRRVVVRTMEGGRQYATLAIVDDPCIVSDRELGLSERAFELLGAPAGTSVAIDPEMTPPSLDAVRAKIHGATFSDAQVRDIINDISANRYSEMEIAAFLVSSASFMSTDEVLSLTRAMADAGNRLSWPQSLVVDKHSIGGIPNNRTSMIVVPIVAAHGLTIPKTSSRAITSPAGTSDTMEVLARVDLDAAAMRRVVESCNGCLIWGGHVNLSPADDVLISVERPLRIDTVEQMVASILSKKLAAGSTHLLLDIPVGPSAKIRSQVEAVRVRKLFEFVARQIGLTLEVLVTSADQPIGRGVGPILEARDVMAVLENRPDGPLDLREKSVLLAGALLEFDPELTGGSGHARARELLDSGAALRSMQAMIEAQGAQNGRFVLGSYMKDVCAARQGRIESIHCQRINRIARLAGAPMDKGAGLDLFKRLGEHVDAGEPLYRIHSCVPFNFDFACEAAAEFSGYRLADE